MRIVLITLASLLNLPSAVAQEIQWKQFISKEGRFSVLMRGVPKEQKQSFKTGGGAVELRLYLIDNGSIAYLVSYNDLPEGTVKGSVPQKILGGARDGAVNNVKGKLISERKITLDGNPGRELKIETGAMVLRQRQFLVKNRLYQTVVVTPREDGDSADGKKFLESFKLTK